MKIDFNQNLKGLDGEPLKDDQATAEEEVRLRKEAEDKGIEFIGKGKQFYVKLKTVVINALMGMRPNENIIGQERYDRGKLAMKIDVGDQDVKAEDVVLIKKLVGESYTPLIVVQVWDILEQVKEEKEG